MHCDLWNSQNKGLAHIVKAKIKHLQFNGTPFETNYRLQISLNFHVHHQIVLQVAENVA